MAQKLGIIIVGGGLGGIAAALGLVSNGHKVAVLEAAEEVAEVGAGIQVTPNFSRILHRWGVGAELDKWGCKADYMRQIRWKDGLVLSRFPTNLNNRMEKTFGYPWYHIHRADLHKIMLDRAVELGAEVRPNSKVVEYRHVSEGKEEVVLESGEVLSAELIIGADGNKTIMGTFVLGGPVKSVATGDSAYRALLSAEKVENILTSDFRTHGTTWVGPERHVIGYFVRDGKYYNMVILVPDEEGEESWKLLGDMEKLRAQFEGWDPRLRQLLDCMETSYVWKLRDRPAMERWLHPEGNLVLLGDSAHPMLPYIGQGASSAVEDAVALTECLQHLGSNWKLRELLKAYETVRIPRTSGMREASRKNRDYFHMPDGPEQEARDTALLAALAEEERGEAGLGKNKTPNQLGDAKKQAETYGYDVVEEVTEFLTRQKSNI